MTHKSQHDLTDFIISASEEIQREYGRISRRTKEDPGTAGDQGEENWATLLRQWLPNSYHIVTKGRILSAQGIAGPQVDVLVLHPAYPKILQDKKHYLADGVIAVFECKTTLRKQHIRKALENGKFIKQLIVERKGTPYKELHAGLLFGILAHSHALGNDSEKALEKLMVTLSSVHEELIDRPRQALDVACIADLGTFTYSRTSLLPLANMGWDEGVRNFGRSRPVTTVYFEHSERVRQYKPGFTSVGVLLTFLLHQFAWEDGSLRRIAKYFNEVIPNSGRGAERIWGEEVFSEDVQSKLLSTPYSDEPWDEWGVLL